MNLKVYKQLQHIGKAFSNFSNKIELLEICPGDHPPSIHPSIHPPSTHHPCTHHPPTIHPPTIHPPTIHLPSIHPPSMHYHPPSTYHPATIHCCLSVTLDLLSWKHLSTLLWVSPSLCPCHNNCFKLKKIIRILMEFDIQSATIK